MNRSQIRELAFKLLYQIEIQKEISDEDMELFFENNNITSEEAKSYIKDVVKGTSTNSQEILELISNNLKKDWNLERITKVNLALLKLAIYEKKYKDMIKRFNLSNVKLLGATKNPYPYIAKSDYLIITSDYEGFPVVYSESIILNTPIVTTINVSDDYISIPNRFGIIVNKDINDISLEIRKLVKNGFKIKEKVDYNLLNKQRIEKIEKIMENRND